MLEKQVCGQTVGERKMNLRDLEIVYDNCLDELNKNFNDGVILNELWKCRVQVDKKEVIEIIKETRDLMFPNYFGNGKSDIYSKKSELHQLYSRLNRQVRIALESSLKQGASVIEEMSNRICLEFIKEIPKIQKLLLKDAEATYFGDPAVSCIEEIIISYPGFWATMVYRIAHILYPKVPILPRIMSEYAHSRTGVDINPGAQIGECFFVDHGTGVVIGETSIIGNNVKIYQGVTLGALSTRKGYELKNIKRHPTIEDDVVIYSGASILGGDTVIGSGTVISGNAFVTTSVPPGSKI